MVPHDRRPKILCFMVINCAKCLDTLLPSPSGRSDLSWLLVRLSSPLVTSLITSFHHSVRFGDLAILTRVNVVMMTLIYSSVDSDDENNNENDGNDNDVI
jgi:hypothetical protein